MLVTTQRTDTGLKLDGLPRPFFQIGVTSTVSQTKGNSPVI